MAVYACSDLHGTMFLYKQIKNFLEPNDIVYFLGDAGDRGSQPWQTIKAIYNNPQFIYLKGNHEDMLVNTMKSYLEEDMQFFHENYDLLCWNGGKITFENWQSENDFKTWVSKLNNLPLMHTYINSNNQKIILNHAGFTPGTDPLFHDLIWDRTHIYHKWPNDDLYKDTVIVHGHTPIFHLAEDLGFEEEVEPGALYYCDDHKICIDNGSFFTKNICLLNLDTFEEHIFSF